MNQLETIAEHLEKLQGEAYLQLKEGPLKESLLEAAAEQDGPFQASELEAVVACRESDRMPLVALHVKDEGETRRVEVAASALKNEALEEISAYLVRLTEKDEGAASIASDDEEGADAQNDTFGLLAAANRLRVSPAWLKSVVPCTFYTYEEIDGRKKIQEYFWSRELIKVLHQLRSKKASPQEVEFIAEHCCEGDISWSREIIGRLKSYSRGETEPKPQQPQKAQQPQKGPHPQKGQQKAQQPQKNQQKAQHKGQPQDAQQPARPAQHQAKPHPRHRPEGERGRKPARSQ